MLVGKEVEFEEGTVLKWGMFFTYNVIHGPETEVLVHAFHHLLTGLQSLVVPVPNRHFWLFSIRSLLLGRGAGIEFGDGLLKI